MLGSGMDSQELFTRLIKQMAAEGSAILLTDEDVTWASGCCTRVVELEEGRIANAYTLESASEGFAPAPERFTPFEVPARGEDRILLYYTNDILDATNRD